jgi:crotonobetainyl-CoA:carnitine CoA-transferase CaiB-like acyl-CoA transferase
MVTEDSRAALGDVRILDLTDEIGVYCTKLLADLGADVIRVENPKGDPVRRRGPFFHGRAEPELSLFHFHFNTSKRSITLNLGSTDGRNLFRKLVRTADVVVETSPPGYLANLGLDYASLKEINPGLILASITGFGQDGPYRQYKAPDIVGVAMGGLMYLGGNPGEPPFYPGAFQGYHLASTDAAIGILLALYHRDLTGEGQQVDISMQESVCEAIEYGAVVWDLMKTLRKRTGRRVYRDWDEVFPCQDGYILCSPLGGGGWEKILAWMDSEGMAADLKEPLYQAALKVMAWGGVDRAVLPPDIDREMLTKDPQIVAHIEEVWQAFLMAHTREELYRGCQERDVRLMPVYNARDITEDPQLIDREFFVEVQHPELKTPLKYAGAPYRLSATPWQVSQRAPLAGEHNLEIYQGELGLSTSELVALKATGSI